MLPATDRWGLGLTLYVAGLTISVQGTRRLVAAMLASAIDFVTDISENCLRLTVSKTKSVVAAYRPAIAREIVKRPRAKSVKPAKRAKLNVFAMS